MPPPINRTRTNPTQAADLASLYPDPVASRQPRIAGGLTSAVQPTQAARLWQRAASALGLTHHAQVGGDDEQIGDIENPMITGVGTGTATNAAVAATTPNIPSSEELRALSDDFIREEQRPIDPQRRAAFFALQKRMIETRDFEPMAEARELLLQMHGVKQEVVDRGFERGGAVYSYRNLVGSMIAFAPLALTYVRTQPEHLKNLDFQVKAAGAYFTSVILASCIGVACNARTLLHCTPIQDAEFDGSPFVANELLTTNTPSYPTIKEELEQGLSQSTLLRNELERSLTEFETSKTDETKERCLQLIEELKNTDDGNKGIQHYLARAQLHRVYIEGLQLQSAAQTVKVFGNLGAGWASFLKKDPRLGMYIQLGVGLGQILIQRMVAPADQKKLQNALFELEIMSRPLSGNDPHRDDQIIRGMMRTPREVRVQNLQNLAISHVRALAQQIGDIVGMSATDYQKYRGLLKRKNQTEEFAVLEARVAEMRDKLTDAQRGGRSGSLPLSPSLRPENLPASTLVDDVRRMTGFDSQFFEDMIDLSRRKGTSLSQEEHDQLDDLKHQFQENILALTDERKYELFGNPALSQALQQSMRSRNATLDSAALSASLGLPSRRLSHEEILAEILDTVARDHCPDLLADLRAHSGEDSSIDDQNAGPFFDRSTSGMPWSSHPVLSAALAESIGVSESDLDRFIDLTHVSKSRSLGAKEDTELQALQIKLNQAVNMVGTDHISDVWGVDGLETELIAASRSQNYGEEKRLSEKISDDMGVGRKTYHRYHELRMLFLDSPLHCFKDDEQATLEDFQNKVSMREGLSPTKVKHLRTLETHYGEIEDDPRHIIQRRFEKISNQHKKLVIDGMQVTRNESLFSLKTETGMLWAEGNRRAGDAAEYMATYAAGMWRAFQLGVTGVNGPLIMTATVSLLEQIYKSTLDDPKSFQSPYWPKVITTFISLAALGANIQAAHRIAEAKAAPLTWNLKLQKYFGGTGSIAETKLQVGKLDIRQGFREAKTPNGDPVFGEIGKRRIAQKYFWETVKAGARIGTGLAILIRGGSEALATRKAYEARDLNMQANRQLRQRATETIARVAAELESTRPPGAIRD